MHDKIATFGDINASNHNDLRNIAHLVKNKENVCLHDHQPFYLKQLTNNNRSLWRYS